MTDSRTGTRVSPCWGRLAYLASVAMFSFVLHALPLCAQQGGVVRGIVINGQTQRPLAGAQILVSGTSRGTLSDIGGHFEIGGLAGTEVTLEVVMIGYRNSRQQVRVGATDVQLTLEQVAIDLDEIVVTGTPGGTQRRALGTSVGTVTASSITEVAPVQSVQQLLGGRVPGVSVIQSSGNLGSGASTRIRGVSTLSLSSEPIIYVDGVRVNSATNSGPSIRGGRQVSRLNDIPPEEIERIEVIRGPAAATLYGTEASNGVIQIFTKRGVSGHPTFDASVKYGANWLPDPAHKYPEVWWKNPTSGELVSLNLVEQESAAGRPIFSNGPIQNYAISARGGSDVILYYLAAEHGREQGIVDYNWQDQNSARANFEFSLGDKIDVSTNLGVLGTNTRLAQSYSGWDLQAQLVWGSPRQATAPVRGFLRAPPDELHWIDARSNVDRSTFSVKVTHRPFTWLTQRLTAGGDIGTERNWVLVPRQPNGSQHFFGALSLGEKTDESRRTRITSFDYAATAALDVRQDLKVSTSVGMQHYARAVESVSAYGRVFPAPGIETVSGGAIRLGDETFLENKTLGFFVQEEIGWRQRVFLTGAIRMDDNSAFGENFSGAVYPKLAATWTLSDESFWSFGLINLMRLRAAWGQAGQQPDVFAAVRLFQPTTGPSDAATVTPQNIGNPDLKPEVGEEIEVGLDASAWEDRLSLGFTYYRKRTHDALVQRPVPPSWGFPGSQYVNLGEVLSKGFELQVTATPLQTKSVTGEIVATLSTADTKVISLGGLPPIVMGRQRHQEGYPVAGFFHRVVVGSTINPNGSVTNVMCQGETASSAPVPCATAPKVYTGPSIPRWQGSISSTLTFGNSFVLTALVDYRGGYYIENGDIGAAHVLIRNTRAIYEAKDPILMGYAQLGDWQRAGFMDAGFAKLREVSMTYTFPQSLTGRTGASHASFTLGGRNLATLWQATKEIWGTKVIDPEMGDTGFYQTVLPQMTSLVATLRVSF